MKTSLLFFCMLIFSFSANADQLNTEPEFSVCKTGGDPGYDSLGKIELDLKPSISAVELDRMQNSIVGDWSSVTYPSDLMLAPNGLREITSMNLQFYQNGVYEKVCQTASSRVEEKGFFEITPDGQYLIFYASGQPGSAPESFSATVVRIKYLRVGEMVLEQPLQAFGLAGVEQAVIRSVAYMQ
jgi:hypothetical protein